MNDYKFKLNYPNKTSLFNYSSDPFSVVICFPIQLAFYKDKQIKKERDSYIFKIRNFTQIEKKTNNLVKKEVFEKWISYGTKVVKFKFVESEKVFF